MTQKNTNGRDLYIIFFIINFSYISSYFFFFLFFSYISIFSPWYLKRTTIRLEWTMNSYMFSSVAFVMPAWHTRKKEERALFYKKLCVYQFVWVVWLNSFTQLNQYSNDNQADYMVERYDKKYVVTIRSVIVAEKCFR